MLVIHDYLDGELLSIRVPIIVFAGILQVVPVAICEDVAIVEYRVKSVALLDENVCILRGVYVP